MSNRWFITYSTVHQRLAIHLCFLGQMRFLILLSKQGKVRLCKWYVPFGDKEKQLLVQELGALIPLRRAKMCNVLEHRDGKIVYKRYASLFFIVGIGNDENELSTLDFIQKYVETLDKAYGNVCELDIVFDFQRAYKVLDELVVGGSLCETSSGAVLSKVAMGDAREDEERLGQRV